MTYKLLIQRFAEVAAGATDKVEVNKEDLTAANSQLSQITEDISTLIKDIISVAKSVVNSEEFQASSTKAFENVLSYIEQFTGGELTESLGSLSTFLTSAINAYAELDVDYSKEIDSWVSTIQTAISGISEGLNSTVAQGSYDAGAFAKDTAGHVSTISGAAQTIVKETAAIISDAGKLHTSYTGSTVQASAIGTIQKLFTFAKSSATTARSFIGSLMTRA